MDCLGIVGIFGTVASIISAIISAKQSKEAKKAKDASEAAQKTAEAAKDKILQNIQYEDFVSFKLDCESFCGTLQKASMGKDTQGKEDNYVENELESFLTRFNGIISNTTGDVRSELEIKYDSMKEMRDTVKTNDKNTILPLLDKVRELSRYVGHVQINNKLSI